MSPTITPGPGSVDVINAGDDHKLAHGRSLPFDWADPTHALGLDDPTAVVRFKCTQATLEAASVTETTAGYHLEFELEREQSAAITMARQEYEIEATLADGDVISKGKGTLIRVSDVPAVG